MGKSKYKVGQVIIVDENAPNISKSYLDKHGLIHEIVKCLPSSNRYLIKSKKTERSVGCPESFILGLALEYESEEI